MCLFCDSQPHCHQALGLGDQFALQGEEHFTLMEGVWGAQLFSTASSLGKGQEMGFLEASRTLSAWPLLEVPEVTEDEVGCHQAATLYKNLR